MIDYRKVTNFVCSIWLLSFHFNAYTSVIANISKTNIFCNSEWSSFSCNNIWYCLSLYVVQVKLYIKVYNDICIQSVMLMSITSSIYMSICGWIWQLLIHEDHLWSTYKIIFHTWFNVNYPPKFAVKTLKNHHYVMIAYPIENAQRINFMTWNQFVFL